MPIQGTRAPATAGGGHRGPEAIRYAVQAAWPGIDATRPASWCDLCTRAVKDGVYQVKYRNVMCFSHARTGTP